MPRPRSVLGVPLTGDQRPTVTMSIIAACVLAYVGQLISPQVTANFAFTPYLGWSEPWRAMTAAFLHSPSMPLHLALNMLFLWQIGPAPEHALGRARYLALYLLGAFGGSVAVVLLAKAPTRLLRGAADAAAYQSWVQGVVGASGAVFGLFGALLVINRHFGRSSTALYAVLAINLAFGFIYPGISWQGHLGGLVTGIAVAGSVLALRAPARRPYQWAAIATIFVVLLGVVIIKYLTVPAFYR